MTYKDFAKYIKEKRELTFITQKDFAKSLPIRVSKYNKIENGNQEPTFMELQLICIALDIDLTEILQLKKPNQQHQAYFD